MNKNQLLKSFAISKFLIIFSFILFVPLALGEIRRASKVVNIQGEKIMFQEGKQRRILAKLGQLLENKSQKLIIPGNNQDFARLAFLGENNDYIEILLQAGPDFEETVYQFPCTLQSGILTVGWKKNKSRGCGDGMYISPQSEYTKNSKENVTNKSSAKMKPGVKIAIHESESILCQVYNKDDKQEIKSLIGNLLITTPNHPNGLILKENEQWTYDYKTQTETITKINSKKVLTSEELEEFLKSSNWFSDLISEENNRQIQQHLTDLRVSIK